jgi:hypothetical protein
VISQSISLKVDDEFDVQNKWGIIVRFQKNASMARRIHGIGLPYNASNC